MSRHMPLPLAWMNLSSLCGIGRGRQILHFLSSVIRFMGLIVPYLGQHSLCRVLTPPGGELERIQTSSQPMHGMSACIGVMLL